MDTVPTTSNTSSTTATVISIFLSRFQSGAVFLAPFKPLWRITSCCIFRKLGSMPLDILSFLSSRYSHRQYHQRTENYNECRCYGKEGAPQRLHFSRRNGFPLPFFLRRLPQSFQVVIIHHCSLHLSQAAKAVYCPKMVWCI